MRCGPSSFKQPSGLLWKTSAPSSSSPVYPNNLFVTFLLLLSSSAHVPSPTQSFFWNSLNGIPEEERASWSFSHRERLSGFTYRGRQRKMSVTLQHFFKAMDGGKGTRLLHCEYTEPGAEIHPTFFFFFFLRIRYKKNKNNAEKVSRSLWNAVFDYYFRMLLCYFSSSSVDGDCSLGRCHYDNWYWYRYVILGVYDTIL